MVPSPHMSMDHHHQDNVHHDARHGCTEHESIAQQESTEEAQQDNGHPLHAFGRIVGDGIQSHVRRWKRDSTRKKLESHLVIVNQARQETDSQHSQQGMSHSQSLQSLGDIGRTLFSPLEGPFESTVSDSTIQSSVSFEMTSTARDDEPDDALKAEEPDAVTADESDEDEQDVFIYNDGTELESPRILTMDLMRQLRHAMPSSTQLKVWKRLYSLARDGDVFQTFLSCVAGNRQTLLVIQTSTGEMFGGFAEAHWGKLAMRTDGSYHGTGKTSNVLARSPCKH